MNSVTTLRFEGAPAYGRPIYPAERQPAATPAAGRVGLPIVLDGVTRAFGQRTILDNIELTIPAGQLLAIVGRSGCGKTTLLRLISGLDRPTAGTIEVGGKPVAGPNGTKLLFQDPRLLPWQRVVGNVGIARHPDWKATAAAALADVGLADRANDWPSVLSGGQKQRVALARALVSRPQVLLLDEPFGALDAITRGEMHDLFAGLWGTHGFTSVLITHDVAEAVALADRVLVLKEGRIALDIPVGLPRPRGRIAGTEAQRLQQRILAHV